MSRPASATPAPVRPDIAALAGYVPGEQPQGGKWIKLNTNENPYAPSPAVARALAATAAGRTLAKYPDPLATVFRLRAAEVLGVDPDWIICGNGSDDLLTILVRTFVGAGECLRMPYPSYILYRTLAGIQGAVCDEFHYGRDWSLADGFAAPQTAAGDDVKLAIIANPNSPSGTLLPPARIRELGRPGAKRTFPFGLVRMDNGEIALICSWHDGKSEWPAIAFSKDGGDTWSEFQDIPGAKGRPMNLAYLGNGRLTFVAGKRFFSNDYGRTWPESVPQQPTSDGLPFHLEGNAWIDRDAERTRRPRPNG